MERMSKLDEITLLEVLNISSEEIVERFADKIEDKFDELEIDWMTPYSTFIAKSRYSRFIPEQNRREHWDESVDRYFAFMFDHPREELQVES